MSPDYNLYMDIQQAIDLDLVQRFEDHEIEFAYMAAREPCPNARRAGGRTGSPPFSIPSLASSYQR